MTWSDPRGIRQVDHSLYVEAVPEDTAVKNDMIEDEDLRTAYLAGNWDPINMPGGYIGDELGALGHPAYRMPTRWQGTTLEAMGF